MKKALLASLILHLIPVFFMLKEVQKQEIEAEKVQSTGGSEKQDKNTGFDVQVIEQVPGGGEKKEAKAHYWGLGISGMYYTTELGQIYRIDNVFAGYNGEAAGLQNGDIIVTVNGQSPMVNDISGDGPKDLLLVVVRGNISLVVNTKRGKVYF